VVVRLADKVIAVGLRAMIQIMTFRTADDPNGPWPPTGDGWVEVRRADGFTFWRLIRLVQSVPPPADARTNKYGGNCNGT
jgi:hypothetical protein